MIIAELTITEPINVNNLNEFITFLKDFKPLSQSITIENYMSHDNLRETVLEMKILTILVRETFGDEFPITEPILVGEDVGNIGRRINIKLHDNVTELEWKE